MISKWAGLKVRIFLGLCQKAGTIDAVTLAHCFFRWQGLAQECHHSADFDKEADHYEFCFFEDFRNGRIPEEDLRDVLEYYKAGRAKPSKYREIHIVEARLEIAKSLRTLQGAVACSAPSKPPMPAKRKAKKKKR